MITTATLNTWAASWAVLMVRGLIDITVLLAAVSLVWLPLRRRMSASLACSLFVLVLIKPLVPIEIAVPTGVVRAMPRHAVERVTGWATGAELENRLDSPAAAANPRLTGTPSPVCQSAKNGSAHPVSMAGPPLTIGAKLMLGWAAVVFGLLGRFGWS